MRSLVRPIGRIHEAWSGPYYRHEVDVGMFSLDQQISMGGDHLAASHAVVGNGVTVRLGGRTILSDLRFSVGFGEVWALLGPNGAGKTTLIDCMEGFRRPDGGTLRVLGHDPWRAPLGWRAQIGAVLQDGRIDADLSVGEYIRMWSGCYARPVAAPDTLALLGLAPLAGRRVHRLSGGERRRLELAVALVGRPRLLFLDEPTAGLDPQARRELWHVIEELRRTGVTVVLTTHMLDEVEMLADRVAILVAGRLWRQGSVGHLRDTADLPTVVSFAAAGFPPADRLPSAVSAERDAAAGRWTLRTRNPQATLGELAATGTTFDVAVRPPSFEDVYLDLLARAEREGEHRHD